MPRLIILFASDQTAAANVAGVPAIARAMREVALVVRNLPQTPEVVLALLEGRLTTTWCHEEIFRLAPELGYSQTVIAELVPAPDDIYLAGEHLFSAEAIAEALRPGSACLTDARVGIGSSIETVMHLYDAGRLNELLERLGSAGKQILRDTIKPTDGIVSRYVNRPISTRISGMLLRMQWVRPNQATALTALAAALMFASLVFGGHDGLIAGAILFQAASLLDGVDGEIARATFRTSATGATLDSLIDALTNLGFLIGLGVNLHLLGFGQALMLGLVGFALLGTGLAVLGWHAVKAGRPVNFDALKHVVKRYQSPLADWIVWLAMRDFLALASAVMVVMGFASVLLVFFAVGTFVWLLAVLSFAVVETLAARRTR